MSQKTSNPPSKTGELRTMTAPPFTMTPKGLRAYKVKSAVAAILAGRQPHGISMQEIGWSWLLECDSIETVLPRVNSTTSVYKFAASIIEVLQSPKVHIPKDFNRAQWLLRLSNHLPKLKPILQIPNKGGIFRAKLIIPDREAIVDAHLIEHQGSADKAWFQRAFLISAVSRMTMRFIKSSRFTDQQDLFNLITKTYAENSTEIVRLGRSYHTINQRGVVATGSTDDIGMSLIQHCQTLCSSEYLTKCAQYGASGTTQIGFDILQKTNPDEAAKAALKIICQNPSKDLHLSNSFYQLATKMFKTTPPKHALKLATGALILFRAGHYPQEELAKVKQMLSCHSCTTDEEAAKLDKLVQRINVELTSDGACPIPGDFEIPSTLNI